MREELQDAVSMEDVPTDEADARLFAELTGVADAIEVSTNDLQVCGAILRAHTLLLEDTVRFETGYAL